MNGRKYLLVLGVFVLTGLVFSRHHIAMYVREDFPKAFGFSAQSTHLTSPPSRIGKNIERMTVCIGVGAVGAQETGQLNQKLLDAALRTDPASLKGLAVSDLDTQRISFAQKAELLSLLGQVNGPLAMKARQELEESIRNGKCRLEARVSRLDVPRPHPIPDREKR
jgi:hypothetical protein